MAVASSIASSTASVSSTSLFAPLGRTPRVLLFAVLVSGAFPAAFDAAYFVQDCHGAGSAVPADTSVSDEIAIPGGRVAYLAGASCGTWRGPHTSTAARYTSASGAHSVRGCIFKRYIELGGPIESGLGFPTSDEQSVTGGRISYFQFGYIFADGHAVYPVFKQ